MQPEPARTSAAAAALGTSGVDKKAKHDERSPLNPLDDDLQADPTVSAEISSADEIAGYLRQTNIPRQVSPLEWWKFRQKDYPRLADVATRYFSAPSTSVPSERLFISAGDLHSDSRNRLCGERTEMLLFIKHDLKFI